MYFLGWPTIGPRFQYRIYPFWGFWVLIYVYNGSYQHHCYLWTDPPV